MKLWRKILLAVLIFALVLSIPMPAHALNASDDPPPLPGWLQWLLQLVGLATPTPSPSAPTPAFTPTPFVSEYRIGSLEELEALPSRLPAGIQARAVVSAADLNAMLAAYLSTAKARSNGLLSGSVTLRDGSVKVEGVISRAWLEKQGLPLFLSGEQVTVSGEGSVSALDCRPVLSLKSVQVNSVSVSAISLLDQMLNEALSKEWPAEVCVESITITPQQIMAQGYRR